MSVLCEPAACDDRAHARGRGERRTAVRAAARLRGRPRTGMVRVQRTRARADPAVLRRRVASGAWRTAQRTIRKSATIGIFRNTINQMKVQASTSR